MASRRASRHRRKPDPGWLAVQRDRYGPGFRPQPPLQVHEVGELVPGLMKRMGLEDASRLAEIQRMWPEVAGPVNAAHARPGKWEAGILTVYVDQPIWLSELKRFAARPLEKMLKQKLGAKSLRRIRFELDPGGEE
jgi:predicted nucleic acid-binding Zn ribbon protein